MKAPYQKKTTPYQNGRKRPFIPPNPPPAPTFWMRRPFPGRFPGGFFGEFSGKFGKLAGEYPGKYCPIIAREIPREHGCASRKFPGGFSGCAAKIPGNPPGNSHCTHFPGNPRGMHFAGNAFPGKYPACQRMSSAGRHISNRGGFPAKRICRAISRTARYRQ